MIKLDVLVLMATCNGESYVREQMATILSQVGVNVHVIVRDAQSTDSTPSILRDLAAHAPGRIEIIEGTTGSARANFSALLDEARKRRFRWIAFSDQDDIWHPDKLCRQLQFAMTRAAYDCTPLLVCSDLRVVDAKGSVGHRSYFRANRLDPRRLAFPQILVQNIASGNTVLVNKMLVDVAGTIPDQAVNHDWWCALVAAAFGRIHVLAAPLVDYRQHGSNCEGSKGFGGKRLLQESKRVVREGRGRVQHKRLQASAFIERFGVSMSEANRQAAYILLQSADMGWLERRRALTRHGLLHGDGIRNLGMVVLG